MVKEIGKRMHPNGGRFRRETLNRQIKWGEYHNRSKLALKTPQF
jgi:hypothetical protein